MKKRVIAYLHTHWDREWYRTKEEFNLRLIEVFDEVISELNCGFAPCFYFDGQTSALIDYLKFRPEKTEVVKKLIKEKKLFIGPFFVSADAFLVNLRCLIKNLEKGISYSRQMGEEADFIGYLSDIFGQSRGVFEILKKFNINFALAWRGIAFEKSELNVRGTKLSRLSYGYFNDILHTGLEIEKKAQMLENFIDKIAQYSGDVLLLPIGGDHITILKNANSEIEKINKYLKKYKIELSNPQKYFEAVDFSGAKEFFGEKYSNAGEFLDNRENYILGGVFSARIYQKIQNAKLMHRLCRVIEPAVWLLAPKYLPNVELAFEYLLKNHAHDSIYGCSIDDVHKDVEVRFKRIKEILDGIEKRIVRDLGTYDKKPDKIAVLNMSNFENKGVVKVLSEHKFKNAQITGKIGGFSDKILYDINKVPITEDYLTLYEQLVEIEGAKPFELATFSPIEPKKKTNVENDFIENPYIKLFVENGEISVIDKVSGKVYKNFIKILDTKEDGDSYNYAPIENPKTLCPTRTKAIIDGKIQSVLRIYFKNLKLDVILNNKENFLTFSAKIKNKEKNHKLQVAFCHKTPVYEAFAQDSLGIIKRDYDPNYSLFENEPAKRPFELKTNSSPMQNFVWAQGAGVLTEGSYEYEIYKNELRIAILRATGIISNPKCPSRAVPAGPPLEIPDAQCLGETKIRFGLAFCNDVQKMFEFSEDFLGTNICFTTDKTYNKKLFKPIKDKLFLGTNSSGKGIFYDKNTENIDFISLQID